MERLSVAGLRMLRTFDLHDARLGAAECSCPHHGTSKCNCQMVVLLIYGEAIEPATLILHGNEEQTWLSFAETSSQHQCGRPYVEQASQAIHQNRIIIIRLCLIQQRSPGERYPGLPRDGSQAPGFKFSLSCTAFGSGFHSLAHVHAHRLERRGQSYILYSFFCHQLPERSYFLFGQRPCTRCPKFSLPGKTASTHLSSNNSSGIQRWAGKSPGPTG